MTSLLETYQDVEDDEAQAIIRLWQRERKSIRYAVQNAALKILFYQTVDYNIF